MKPITFMVNAGEPSGDLLAGELVMALRTRLAEVESNPSDEVQPLRTSLEPRFFGGGGPQMAAAGVELTLNLSREAVIGLAEVLKHFRKFRGIFRKLLHQAIARQPEVIIGVDYGGFNRRFAKAIKAHVRRHRRQFNNWNPLIVQFVSPQVWASREGRAYQLERDVDLMLSIIPFEKQWYAEHTPKLSVEFVGHPILDRHGRGRESRVESRAMRVDRPIEEFRDSPQALDSRRSTLDTVPRVLLLPGSRLGELRRHLPVMVNALNLLRKQIPTLACQVVFPNDELATESRSIPQAAAEFDIQIGGLSKTLAEADITIASTGTVTLECAYFGVPTVAIYKTSWSTYQIGKRVIRVNYLAMPNLLAGEMIFPELIQDDATPEKIAKEAFELLTDEQRRRRIKAQLAVIINSLGQTGACERAANAILHRLQERLAGSTF